MMTNSVFIEIPCLLGKHGATQQFVTTISAAALMRMIGNALTNETENPEIALNKGFIRSLSKQMKQPDSVISYTPIVVAVFGDVAITNSPEHSEFGQLRIPALAKFRILDGLHRMAALRAANLPHLRLSSEYLPVSFVPVADDKQFNLIRKSLAKRQSTGRNITSKRVQKNSLLERSKNLIAHSPFLQKAVALGKSSLAPRSQQLFPHTAFARACTPLFNALAKTDKMTADKKIAEYWNELCQVIPPWKAFEDSQITASDVRNSTALTSTAVLVALGQVGAIVLVCEPDNWSKVISPLSLLYWGREKSSVLEGAAIKDGVLLRGEVAESQTFEVLKGACKLCG
jgi:DGQHR domain-containing protein